MSFLKSLLARIKSFFSKAEEAVESFNGWIPDHIDPRDHVFSLAQPVPTAVDLRPKMRPIDQQGPINSCVGNSVTVALETVLGTEDLSRMFVYYNARAYEGRATMDSGCQIRNAVKSVVVYGVPPETAWPYDTSKFAVKPSTDAFVKGIPLKARVGYATVTSLASLKTALATGLPVVFGFSVPDTFVSLTKYDGYLPVPNANTKYIGAHAVVAVGYDDAKGTVLCRNSFGENWGKGGYFEMPYAWFNNMVSSTVSDAWVLSPKS